jgi:hypothetical protein
MKKFDDIENIYNYSDMYVIVVMKNGSNMPIIVSDPIVVAWKKIHKIKQFKIQGKEE